MQSTRWALSSRAICAACIRASRSSCQQMNAFKKGLNRQPGSIEEGLFGKFGRAAHGPHGPLVGMKVAEACCMVRFLWIRRSSARLPVFEIQARYQSSRAIILGRHLALEWDQSCWFRMKISQAVLAEFEARFGSAARRLQRQANSTFGRGLICGKSKQQRPSSSWGKPPAIASQCGSAGMPQPRSISIMIRFMGLSLSIADRASQDI
jgi:hypothetical protein